MPPAPPALHRCDAVTPDTTRTWTATRTDRPASSLVVRSRDHVDGQPYGPGRCLRPLRGRLPVRVVERVIEVVTAMVGSESGELAGAHALETEGRQGPLALRPQVASQDDGRHRDERVHRW